MTISTRTFYRTIVTVEVLSEEPLPPEIDLDDLAMEIMDGDYSGKVEWGRPEAIDGPTAARLLRAQGSAPEFFQLNDDGEDIEE
jgi:hypothetical protein